MRKIKEILDNWHYKTGGLSDYFVFLFVILVICLALGFFQKYTQEKGFNEGYEAGYYQALRDYGIEYED